MDYKYELIDNRPQLFGIVIRTSENVALATSGGAIIVGTKQDMQKLFDKLIEAFVPIDPRTTVPLKNIRVHAAEFFKD